MTATTLIRALSDEEFAIARTLIVEYADQLGTDLCFQGFARELETLEQMYGPPHGCLLLARRDEQYAGCVGVRQAGPGSCEMKRLYLREAARGAGVGRRLAQAAIDAGRGMGYERMLLDTLGTMIAARQLYAALGFKEIPAYYDNPIQGVTYMALDLRDAG
jgi:putative acetyltransferase